MIGLYGNYNITMLQCYNVTFKIMKKFQSLVGLPDIQIEHKRRPLHIKTMCNNYLQHFTLK